MADIYYIDPNNGNKAYESSPTDPTIDNLDGSRIPVGAVEMVRVPNGPPQPTGRFMGANGPEENPNSVEGTPTPRDGQGGNSSQNLPSMSEDDAEVALNEASAEDEAAQGVNQSSSGGYLPGQYNPTQKVKIEASVEGFQGGKDGNIFGSGDAYAPGGLNNFVSQGDLLAMGPFGDVAGKGVEELSYSAAKAMMGTDQVTPAMARGAFRDAVQMAAVTGESVQEALRKLVKQSNGGSGATNGAGGVGPQAFTNVSKSLNLTNASTAERILNDSLASYLGRRASDREIQEFVKQLNRNERFNPVETVTKGVRSQAGTTSTSEQTGGFDSTLFAEKWAASQEGAGEYAAATTYMDAFQQVINELEY